MEIYNIPEPKSLDFTEGLEENDNFKETYLNFISEWENSFDSLDDSVNKGWFSDRWEEEFLKFVGDGVEYTNEKDLIRYKKLVEDLMVYLNVKYPFFDENDAVMVLMRRIIFRNNERILFLKTPDLFLPENFTEEFPFISERLNTDEYKLYFYDYFIFCIDHIKTSCRVTDNKKQILTKIASMIESVIRKHEIENLKIVNVRFIHPNFKINEREYIPMFAGADYFNERILSYTSGFIDVLAFYTQIRIRKLREVLLPYKYKYTHDKDSFTFVFEGLNDGI